MNSLKLLVVDDEADFADFVSEVARNMNFEVLSTDNPLMFADLYSTTINIIILDLFMPRVDGIELLRFLYENKTSASIIFMSGKDRSVLHSAQKLAVEQGLDVLGVLQKPFRAEDLEQVLTEYIQDLNLHGSDQEPDPDQPTAHMPAPAELRQAIEDKALFLSYQPQINLSSGEVTGVEALIRWQHPDKGRIPASYFIPLAEENGLISDVTTFATTTAIRQMAEWQDKGINLRMSINFSPKILDNLEMPGKLARYVAKSGADISNITIEVTETALMADVAKYMDILARLRMKGFSLAIDDFGTGYSSLKQLVRAPFSKLKIDQLFVRKMDIDNECRTIVEISILLAHKLGMQVIAEGIENEKVNNILRELDCDEGQGYWIAKPMQADEIEAWLAKRAAGK
ncbi:diguanylate cyclase/phosphodiesterase (GGDEF & EAL domains) with PAS/PAC sensor(s) [hydrothermal vent metagenome]|uniref:Diguanylate cyclase/phosphodiesterase (GGDEF & EAL domains) with PAS/PAC sensor(S) n=1 Tax=hydrothermal vent metagenome TaxID=652676 RepID=A0A3B0S4Y0_9ZZZZ